MWEVDSTLTAPESSNKSYEADIFDTATLSGIHALTTSIVSQDHGLGELPDNVSVSFRCITAAARGFQRWRKKTFCCELAEVGAFNNIDDCVTGEPLYVRVQDGYRSLELGGSGGQGEGARPVPVGVDI